MRMIYAVMTGDRATTATFALILEVHNRNLWIRTVKFPVRCTVP